MSDIGSKQYLCIFGGGAIRGLAYLGALRAMKEIGVQIKSFAGSSVGAVFAAYASLDYTYEDIHIYGVIGKPEIARSNRINQIFFVNKRYIKDKS